MCTIEHVFRLRSLVCSAPAALTLLRFISYVTENRVGASVAQAWTSSLHANVSNSSPIHDDWFHDKLVELMDL